MDGGQFLAGSRIWINSCIINIREFTTKQILSSIIHILRRRVMQSSTYTFHNLVSVALDSPVKSCHVVQHPRSRILKQKKIKLHMTGLHLNTCE